MMRGVRGFSFVLSTIVALSAGSVAAADTAPDCTLHIGGQEQHVSALRGRVLYVDFWASWCTTCVLSFPFMNDVHRTYSGRGLTVVGVGMDEKPDAAERFLERHPTSFSIALNENAPCAKAFGVAAMPSTFLIDRNGVIRFTHQGFRPGDEAELRANLEKLLAEH